MNVAYNHIHITEFNHNIAGVEAMVNTTKSTLLELQLELKQISHQMEVAQQDYVDLRQSFSQSTVQELVTQISQLNSNTTILHNQVTSAQTTASRAMDKICYVTNTAFTDWGHCPFGGRFGGGWGADGGHLSYAGINNENTWTVAAFGFLCCT